MFRESYQVLSAYVGYIYYLIILQRQYEIIQNFLMLRTEMCACVVVVVVVYLNDK